MTRVFDLGGTERSLEWLAANYDGCGVLPARILPGNTEVWRLAAIFVTEGPALFKFEARRDGKAADNQTVAFTYPSLSDPSPGLEWVADYSTAWAARAVVHRTNNDGIYGAGLGQHYGPLYHAWVLSSAPSDCLTKAGMKGGTEHRGPLHGVWILEDVEPDHATLDDALLYRGERAQVIQFNPDAALQKRIFADGFVPNSPEFTVEFGGVRYVAQRAENLGSGAVRVYYARSGDWSEVGYAER